MTPSKKKSLWQGIFDAHYGVDSESWEEIAELKAELANWQKRAEWLAEWLAVEKLPDQVSFAPFRAYIDINTAKGIYGIGNTDTKTEAVQSWLKASKVAIKNRK